VTSHGVCNFSLSHFKYLSVVNAVSISVFIAQCIRIMWCIFQIPIVDDEMKRAAGNLKEEDIQMTQGNLQKLVTADGTYASQSAFSTVVPVKKEQSRSLETYCVLQ
jgi:hypothetical protein